MKRRTRMDAEGICLQDLANLAIGTPEVGAVNFTALHTLLHAIIKHLHIQDVSVELPGGTRPCPPSEGILVKGEDRMERRILHIEKQLEALNNLPSGLDLIERSNSGQQGGSGAVEDMWQVMKMKRRLEVNEEGVCKAMTVLQDLMLEVNTLKNSQREVQDQIQKAGETAALEARRQLEQKHNDGKTELEKESLQKEQEFLKTQMRQLEEKLEVFHETLARRPESQSARTSFTSQPGDNDISDKFEPIQGTEISKPRGHKLAMPHTQGSSQAEDSALPMETSEDGVSASTLEDTQIDVSRQHHERYLTHSHPGAPVPNDSEINPSMTGMDTTGVTPELPAGATSKEHAMLYTRVDALERDKADRSELGLLQRNTDDLAKTLHDLQEKLSNLNREMQDLRVNTDKLDRLERAIDPTGTSQQKLEENGLGATIKEIEKELKELRKRQKQKKATMEQSAADKPPYLQDQHGELMDHIQKTMSQLQEECERLSRTTGSLIQDHEQKQRDIDVLYQTVETLDKNKVDKEPTGLETDVKADKRALESKVSRTHFDATTEHLSRMMQDLLGKVSAQEQDWQRVLETINVEMQNKLDRMELEPLKNILEQCWRDLHRQLQEHPPQYEADEAAGIRKQLIRRFHCISCNRMVDMVVPGSEMLTIPNFPGLPAHQSNRPYTVFELNQIRQQSRNDRLPQLSDIGYISSTRNCGGSHTLTFPQRRYTRLQPSTPCTVQKEDSVADLRTEVFILGQDGHLYRGRRDNQLPTLKTKDGKRPMVAHQKLCDCNFKGEDNLFNSSSAIASDIHSGVSKSHMKSAQGSEQALPSIKDRIPPMCI